MVFGAFFGRFSKVWLDDFGNASADPAGSSHPGVAFRMFFFSFGLSWGAVFFWFPCWVVGFGLVFVWF